MNISAIYRDNNYQKTVKIIEIISTPNAMYTSCKAVVVDVYTGEVFATPLSELKITDSRLITKT